MLLKIKKLEGCSVAIYWCFELLLSCRFFGTWVTVVEDGPRDGLGTATSVVLVCRAQHTNLASDTASVVLSIHNQILCCQQLD